MSHETRSELRLRPTVNADLTRGGRWHPQLAKRILEQLKAGHGRDSNYLPGRF